MRKRKPFNSLMYVKYCSDKEKENRKTKCLKLKENNENKSKWFLLYS